MTAERKREAREKFLLGGIVVRAGLANVDRAVLLGHLIELARLPPDTSEYRRLRDIGACAFAASPVNRRSPETAGEER